MKIFYKPQIKYIILDTLILLLSILVMFEWFPLTTRTPYGKYAEAVVFYALFWWVISYIFGRYQSLKSKKFFDAIFQLLYVTLFVYGLSWLLMGIFFPERYSFNVLTTYTLGVYLINNIVYSFIYAWLYAIEYDKYASKDKLRLNARVKILPALDDKSYNDLCVAVRTYSGEKIFNFINKNIDLRSGNTKVLFSLNFFDLKSIPDYQHDVYVQLKRINDIRGINTMFSMINEKLPDFGTLICCFESKSTHKRKIFEKYPPVLSGMVYFFDYVFRRFIPKIQLFRRLYFDITKGKNRVLSKTEVLGRLYCCGFEVIKETKADGLCFIFARRIKQAEPIVKRTYGPFIKLRRMGKNGEMFDVYKMRTMYPFSEYLQSYIYEKNDLKEGGKFNRDIRINTLGRFMRRFWIDELPMIYNWFRGEMKLVGIRPLSKHYFNLYSKELREKRVKFKPGLMPPFYADMPKTLDEIQASEFKYLNECETNGVFKTDVKYFFLIIRNIFIKKARSA